ncbi:alpha-galactosidase [Lederbergia wuyishanensis]|uniref:alpha-galactosidase n=1 Tax=Lederbergia wuyishanensis TaxID=1347903 RepID=A0ABU0CZ38_9BACI|nr:alpha-galactosidase [Lederbergia wuyishanensis]MCJ8006038.1 alpha-galactosidase [Lederbergia wuyishanensis]MDQ0341406.1 alpha-galactosidase [Lederbergia wuyishanensis]
MTFGILCNSKWLTAEDFTITSSKVVEHGNGSREEVMIFIGTEFNVNYHIKSFNIVEERWLVIENTSKKNLTIERIDTINDKVSLSSKNIKYFKSGWGNEYQPFSAELTETLILESRAGRSSEAIHPYVLVEDEKELSLYTVAWSGNWILRFEPEEDTVTISGGISNWEFTKTLGVQEKMESIHIIIAKTASKDMNILSNEISRFGKKFIYPKNDSLKEPLVEWNHWWSYEDVDINEDVFKANVDVGKDIGVDVCTLDAGWFGPSDQDSHWYDWRGDWELVNTARFPSGIKHLADYVHNNGMKFGFWCEIEGLGRLAKIREAHPLFPAKRDDEDLGYICFGNPDAQNWAFTMLDEIITNYGCDWIKLDFNLNPGAGCNRCDHGYDCGDGLLEHYNGYYQVLSRIREKHPNIILENCPSGGLRTDLGIMKQTHLNFLSDPDYSMHKFQLFWGSSILLPPSHILHWMWSKTRKNSEGTYPFPPLDLELCTEKQLNFHLRLGMVHRFGFSHPLSTYKIEVIKKLKKAIKFYKAVVFPFISNADLFRLTGQALNNGVDGDLWNAYQYVMPKEGKSIVFIFCMDDENKKRTFKLFGLDKEVQYCLKNADGNRIEQFSGEALMTNGITIEADEKWESHVILIDSVE